MRLAKGLSLAQGRLSEVWAVLHGHRTSTRSSVSGRPSYVDFCDLASRDHVMFSGFRSAAEYTRVLEHVTRDQGAEYLAVIERDSPHLLGEQLSSFAGNDDVGSPATFDYPPHGTMSPTTLRYLKVLSDIERTFGDLTDRDVVEIGVGYGGQARLILKRWRVRSYTLIDLDPVLRLTVRYLSATGTPGTWVIVGSTKVRPLSSDLVISNYAFTELDRTGQDEYATKVLRRASCGYITCNFISDDSGIRSWSRDEIERLHPGSRWVPEEPVTDPRNRILVWGDH